LAVELACTPWDIEDALMADMASRAVLTRGEGAPPAPEQVVQRYNTAAVATVLAAASFVVVRLPLENVAALKELYRRARGLRVGVDLTVSSAGRGAHVQATLYGPGSRALVRLRAAADEDGDDDQADGAEQGWRANDAALDRAYVNTPLLPAAGGPALPLVV